MDSRRGNSIVSLYCVAVAIIHSSGSWETKDYAILADDEQEATERALVRGSQDSDIGLAVVSSVYGAINPEGTEQIIVQG